jgi:hypothetical protein
MAGQGLAGLAAAAEAATAADRWMHHVKQEPQTDAADGAMLATPPQHAAGQFAGAQWQYGECAGPAAELYWGSGGGNSSMQYQQEPSCQLYQQQEQLQQPRSMRSCAPRRSSHHSWSGAPRSFPGASEGDQDPFEGLEEPNGPAGWSTDILAAAETAEAADAGAARVGEGDTGAGAGQVPVGRVMQPRASEHGFIVPQHLGGRTGELLFVAL